MNNNNHPDDALVPFNPWLFGILWVLLHLISELLLHFLLPMIDSTITISIPVSALPDARDIYIAYYNALRTLISGFIMGLVIGSIEWYVLHRYFEWSKWWISVTIVGLILESFWYNYTIRFMALGITTMIFFITITIGGILLGAAQWVVLQKETHYAYLWIVAGFVGGVAGFIVIELYLVGINQAVDPYSLEGTLLHLSRKVAEETIKVAILIGLLNITLKRDEAIAA